MKQNHSTREKTKKDIEDELSNWFGNARDRGEGARRLCRQPAVQRSGDASATAADADEEC